MGLADRFRAQADAFSDASLSSKLRDARFAHFLRLLEGRTGTTRVLDIGGTANYWERRGFGDDRRIEITTLNHAAEPSALANVTAFEGDATDLSRWEDDAFDIVFSNSTIEHLFTFQAQQAMAREVRRLAPAYYVQTPGFWFPVEPHYLTPGWQYLPRGLRVAVLTRTRVGHRGPLPHAQAVNAVDEIKLLRRRQVRQLFPDADIVPERIGPFTKSFMAIREARRA